MVVSVGGDVSLGCLRERDRRRAAPSEKSRCGALVHDTDALEPLDPAPDLFEIDDGFVVELRSRTIVEVMGPRDLLASAQAFSSASQAAWRSAASSIAATSTSRCQCAISSGHRRRSTSAARRSASALSRVAGLPKDSLMKRRGSTVANATGTRL